MGSTDAMQPVSEVPQILQQNPMVDVKPHMLHFKIPVVIKKANFKEVQIWVKGKNYCY